MSLISSKMMILLCHCLVWHARLTWDMMLLTKFSACGWAVFLPLTGFELTGRNYLINYLIICCNNYKSPQQVAYVVSINRLYFLIFLVVHVDIFLLNICTCIQTLWLVIIYKHTNLLNRGLLLDVMYLWVYIAEQYTVSH